MIKQSLAHAVDAVAAPQTPAAAPDSAPSIAAARSLTQEYNVG